MIPTPSPVVPGASLPARWARRSTMASACSTVRWVYLPSRSATAPTPQPVDRETVVAELRDAMAQGFRPATGDIG